MDILKRRFGEASLQGCEVMIKDLQDSKRIDTVIHLQVAVRGYSLLPCQIWLESADSHRSIDRYQYVRPSYLDYSGRLFRLLPFDSLASYEGKACFQPNLEQY